MFCSRCGKQIEDETARFCSGCGAALGDNVSPDTSGNQASFAHSSKLWTNENATMQVTPQSQILVQKANQLAIRNRTSLPPIIHDTKFKAKCEYCMTVFTYHLSNLGYRKWYPHGFVYCPMCRRPLRHSPDLLLEEYDLILSQDGRSYSVQQ